MKLVSKILCFAVCFSRLSVNAQECHTTTTTSRTCGESIIENTPISKITIGKKGPKGFILNNNKLHKLMTME